MNTKVCNCHCFTHPPTVHPATSPSYFLPPKAPTHSPTQPTSANSQPQGSKQWLNGTFPDWVIQSKAVTISQTLCLKQSKHAVDYAGLRRSHNVYRPNQLRPALH